MNGFNKAAEYKINIQKNVAFLDTNNKLSEKKLKTNVYNCIRKTKIPSNKFNQGGERPVF